MTLSAISTRPYLIRALYEWCADNGFTPFIAVAVDASVSVPAEYVKDGEIVLNISMDATSGLQIGNEAVEFKGRFGGVARDIYVPIHRVLAIYARENGQGMAFPLLAEQEQEGGGVPSRRSPSVASESKASPLKGVPAAEPTGEPDSDPTPPRPAPGARPTLTRVK